MKGLPAIFTVFLGPILECLILLDIEVFGGGVPQGAVTSEHATFGPTGDW